ncbi:MAG: LCP family protein [Candidatus Faecivicinus sp.]
MGTQYTDYPNADSSARNLGSDAPRPSTARPTRPRPASSRFGDLEPTPQPPRQRRPVNGDAQARPRSSGAARPADRDAQARARSSGTARSAARRPRPASGKPPRRRRPNGRFFGLLAIIIVLLVAIGLLLFFLLRPKGDPGTAVISPEPTVEATADATEAPGADATQSTAAASHTESLATLLGDADSSLEGLSADELAKVDDLCINDSLPEEWLNVLLLGSDERTLEESARTDSMIICSINLTTGEVKLTSIMRDLAVIYDEIGSYNGTYRINAANFFGGENLAMRIVNECFNMNIEYYVHVNFYGFQQVAQQLGGIEMDITKEEMDEINYRIVQQAKSAYKAGIDESALPNEYLTTYGENTHLDGRQTLAYARIRKLDGGDYARAERQRKVLVALMDKLRGSSAAELLNVANAALPHIKTNLTPDTILSIALKVLQSGLSDVDSLRLPLNNTYVQETRDGQDMLYDCDWEKNASELYYFIYE